MFIYYRYAPFFENRCGHSLKLYKGSVQIDDDKYDVYVFEGTFEGESACFRYGDENHEYISPGGLDKAIARHKENVGHPCYGENISPEALAKHIATYRECFKLAKPGCFD